MEPREKIVQDIQSIKIKYKEGINILRVLDVADHAKLFHGLENLMSGYKVLEELENYLQSCGSLINDETNQNNSEPVEHDNGEESGNFLEEEGDTNFIDIEIDPVNTTPIVMTNVRKSKVDTDDENYEPHAKKHKKNVFNIDTVDTIDDWHALNQRAMDQDPSLLQHVQIYESPKKWIMDNIKDEVLVQFIENPVAMLSSPMFTMLFDYWNSRFTASLNDPEFCCRNALMNVMSKSIRKVLEKTRVQRKRYKDKMEALIRDGKGKSCEFQKVQASDEILKKRQQDVRQIKAKRTKKLNTSKGSAKLTIKADKGAKRLDKKLLKKQLNRKRENKGSSEHSEIEDTKFLVLYE